MRKKITTLCLALIATLIFSTVAHANVLDSLRDSVGTDDFTPFEFVTYTDTARGLTLEIIAAAELDFYTERARSYLWSTDGAFIWYQITLPNVESARLLSAAEDRATNFGDEDGRVVASSATPSMAVALGESPDGTAMRIGLLSIHDGFNFVFTAAFPASELNKYFDVLERLVNSFEGGNVTNINVGTPAAMFRPTIVVPTVLERSGLRGADFGTLTLPCGAQYEGELSQRRPPSPLGNGRAEWPDGRMFIGVWSGGSGHGVPVEGVMVFPSGDKFEGRFHYYQHDQPGNGTYLWADGTWYAGQWYNGVPHGLGVRGFENGDVFEGHFINGVPSDTGCDTFISIGTRHFANGDMFTGWVTSGKPDGGGTLTLANGDTIIGNLQNGQFVGTVTVSFANGDTFEGAWRNGRPYGNGTMVANGQRQVGTWDANGAFTPRPAPPATQQQQQSTQSIQGHIAAIRAYQQALDQLRRIGAFGTPEWNRVYDAMLEEISRMNR